MPSNLVHHVPCKLGQHADIGVLSDNEVTTALLYKMDIESLKVRVGNYTVLVYRVLILSAAGPPD